MKGSTTSSPGPIVAMRPSVPTSVCLSGEGEASARSLSRPSAARSSQKIWRSSHQSPRTQCVRYVVSGQGVVRAIVPNAASPGLTLPEDMASPRNAGVVLISLTFWPNLSWPSPSTVPTPS